MQDARRHVLIRPTDPTYNFANVVDDHLMGIIHVVRERNTCPAAEIHLLYDALGWQPRFTCT